MPGASSILRCWMSHFENERHSKKTTIPNSVKLSVITFTIFIYSCFNNKNTPVISDVPGATTLSVSTTKMCVIWFHHNEDFIFLFLGLSKSNKLDLLDRRKKTC
jgi:hypothetical protein